MSEADDKSLSHSNGAAKNYGTVTTRVSPGGYLEHKVEETDTLQGIALKYGTTVRRVPRYCPSYQVSFIVTSTCLVYLNRWRLSEESTSSIVQECYI